MSERTVTAGRETTGGDGAGGAEVPVRLAAVFLPAPLPREGRIAFYDPEPGPDGTTGAGTPGKGPLGREPLDTAPLTDGPLAEGPPGDDPLAGGPLDHGPLDHGLLDHGGPEVGGAGGTGAVRRTELTVVRPHGSGVRRRTVPAFSLPVDEALPLLVRARHDPAAH
ncbi:hypothetical protein GTW38_26815, partial [Streptomyces sp. SID7804]|nr:hypothetical protein [Streptomyces sp. SID7804]